MEKTTALSTSNINLTLSSNLHKCHTAQHRHHFLSSPLSLCLPWQGQGMQSQIRPMHEWHAFHPSQAAGRGRSGAGGVRGKGRRGGGRKGKREGDCVWGGESMGGNDLLI